jgi:hypothetical protein
MRRPIVIAITLVVIVITRAKVPSSKGHTHGSRSPASRAHWLRPGGLVERFECASLVYRLRTMRTLPCSHTAPSVARKTYASVRPRNDL